MVFVDSAFRSTSLHKEVSVRFSIREVIDVSELVAEYYYARIEEKEGGVWAFRFVKR